jgi:hypothetical protein
MDKKHTQRDAHGAKSPTTRAASEPNEAHKGRPDESTRRPASPAEHRKDPHMVPKGQ